jgi:hypothetical protein
VSLRDILNTNHCDWRVALCVTSGYADLSRHIYVYDGRKINEQLDKRSSKILAKKIRVDSSPPSILSNSPSIMLPKSLSSLLLTPTVPMSVASERTSSGQDHTRNVTSPSNLDDPRVWIPLITKYLQPEAQRAIDQLFTQTNYRIYVFFELPDYNRFKFLQLVHHNDDNECQEGEGEEGTEGTEEHRQDDSFVDRESSMIQSPTLEVQQKLLEETGKQQQQQEQEEEQEQEQEQSPENEEVKALEEPDHFSSLPRNSRHSLAHQPKSRSHEIRDRDRSLSLDSGQGGSSPLKLSTQQPPKEQRQEQEQEGQPSRVSNSLVANLFSDDSSEATTATATNTRPPPIPTSSPFFSNSRGNSVKRTSIDELRLALQSEPTQQQIQQQRQQQPQQQPPATQMSSSNKGGKRKSFFGWKSSS